ncbi:unnamed protein product [Blepharisma stoltei]|uniref:Peroxisomal membrane protein PEX14-like KPWE domain-containing protein n=1 Tax=Blepharisma stoltei TaxID=1481888 RepID=A0AAU9K7C2_9CILI|nr:unnamed protein product [Blepharisma stoltei]
MIGNFEQAFEQMYQTFNQSFKPGTFWNIQGKLLKKYIDELLENPNDHNRIDLNSKAFNEFGMGMEAVLISIGFAKEAENLVYQGSIDELSQNKDRIMKIIDEKKYFSFAEISEIIGKGEQPPGIKQIDDRAVEEPPSVSTLERPQKPWEREENS